jgi:hypothetical protein
MSGDKTRYARLIGYEGNKTVIISDGKVISHRGVDWFEFCHRLRKRHNAMVAMMKLKNNQVYR